MKKNKKIGVDPEMGYCPLSIRLGVLALGAQAGRRRHRCATGKRAGRWGSGAVMSAKLIYVLSSFHMLFCAFYIHIHVKLIKFPLNFVL